MNKLLQNPSLLKKLSIVLFIVGAILFVLGIVLTIVELAPVFEVAVENCQDGGDCEQVVEDSIPRSVYLMSLLTVVGGAFTSIATLGWVHSVNTIKKQQNQTTVDKQ